LNTKQNENIAEIFVQKFERSIQKVWWGESSVLFMTDEQGRSQTFSSGGATGGASFATRGAVNGRCRTFRKRPTPVT